MKILHALLILTIFMTGCSQQISEFVRGGTKRLIGDDLLPSYSEKHPIGTKVSPGANVVAGAQVRSRFAITPTERVVQGTQVKARFSFHQNRPK